MKLFYRIYGDGKPVLIIHGLYSMSDAWIPAAKILALHGFRCIVPDLPNHGWSPHAERHDYDEIADELYHNFIKEESQKVYIVGHSMGGKVSMVLINRYPDAVKKAVLVDIAPREYFQTKAGLNHRAVLRFMVNFDWTGIKTRNDFVRTLPKGYRTDPGFFLKNIRKAENGGLEWKINVRALLNSLDEIKRKIDFSPKCDTLYIKGELSDYISESDAAMILKTERCRLSVISGGGHRLHSEKTEDLTRLILDFFV